MTSVRLHLPYEQSCQKSGDVERCAEQLRARTGAQLSASAREGAFTQLQQIVILWRSNPSRRASTEEKLRQHCQTLGNDVAMAALLWLATRPGMGRASLALLRQCCATLPAGIYGPVHLQPAALGWYVGEAEAGAAQGIGAIFGQSFDSISAWHNDTCIGHFDQYHADGGFRRKLIAYDATGNDVSDYFRDDPRGDQFAYSDANATVKYTYAGGEQVTSAQNNIDPSQVMKAWLPLVQQVREDAAETQQLLDARPSRAISSLQTFARLYAAEDFTGLETFRASELPSLRISARQQPTLASLVAWQPHTQMLQCATRLLAQQSTSQQREDPAVAQFLRLLLHAYGPVVPVTMGTASKQYAFTPWGQDEHQVAFVAKRMFFSLKGYANVVLRPQTTDKPALEFVFHQENHARPRLLLPTLFASLRDGLLLAYKADIVRKDDLLHISNDVLRNLLNRGPCLDGRVSAMQSSLLKHGLVEDAAHGVADLYSEDMFAQSNAHLQAFREQRLAQFAAQHPEIQDEPQQIEADPRYAAHFFHGRAFRQYLEDQGFFADKTAAEAEEVMHYQLQTIAVLTP